MDTGPGTLNDETKDGKDGRILINGLLRVTDGTLNGGFSRGLGSLGGGSFWQEGGTANVWQFRPKSTGTGIFSYKQTGGTFNVGYGFALSGGIIDQYEVQYARFDLSNTNCSFEMSGSATLNIAKPTSNQTTPRIGGLFSVAAGSGNYNVTGGTVNLYTGDKSTNGLTYVGGINSTVPLYNVNIYVDNVAVTPQSVQLQTNSLVVLNNLTVNRGVLKGTLTQNTSTLLGMTAGTYTNVSATSGGTGTAAQFTVVVGSATSITSVTVTSGGGGYLAGDVLTFAGSQFGGSSSATFNVAAANIVTPPTLLTNNQM